MVKNKFQKIWMEEKYLNPGSLYHWKSRTVAFTMLMSQSIVRGPLLYVYDENRQNSTCTTFVQFCTGFPRRCNKQSKGNEMYSVESIQLLFSAENTTTENLREFLKMKQPELTSKLIMYKVTNKNPLFFYMIIANN